MALVNESVTWIADKLPTKPKLGIILRQNLEYWIEGFQEKQRFPFDEIPHFQPSQIPRRKLNLYFVNAFGIPTLVYNGRLHFYEGFTMHEVTHPIRTMVRLGAKTVIITNAAGLVSDSSKLGSFMFLADHINLMGTSPLRGLIYHDSNRHFPSMVDAYDADLRREAMKVVDELSIPAFEGVYCAVAGPAFETPTETRFLRLLGVDAVGMSTVPDVQAARQEGAKVLAISLLTNLVGIAGVQDEEVSRIAAKIAPQLAKFLDTYIPRIRERL